MGTMDMNNGHLSGGFSNSGGPGPDYSPPDFKYKDIDEIALPPGRYHKGGHWHRGQYLNPDNLATYWDIESQLAVNIAGSYSFGFSSGILGGKVSSSWYSVFLMGNDVNSVLLLPFIRVKAISYSIPWTTIHPADHATGTLDEDDFLTANDQWNGYRLIRISNDLADGKEYTISDCVNDSPDQLLITGDMTSDVFAGDWFRLVPPSGTACVYLGFVGFDSSGNLMPFYKKGRRFDHAVGVKVEGNKSASAIANTDMSIAMPPSAELVELLLCIGADDSQNESGFFVYLYEGTSGGMTWPDVKGIVLPPWNPAWNMPVVVTFNLEGAPPTWRQYSTKVSWRMRAPGIIRNQFLAHSGGTANAPEYGYFVVNAAKE